MMKTNVLLIALSIFIRADVLCQEVIDINNIYPPSPDSREFAKVEDLPIDYFSGKANISIPLINAKSRQLTFDIVASYNMETLKVTQRAGIIGYNWNLNLPYKITRTIIGKPDESSHGYFNMAKNLPKDINEIYTNPEYFDYNHKKSIVNGIRDYEPDVFNFSLPGINGQFVFHVDQDGSRNIHTIPHQNIKIHSDESLSYFMLTTMDGTKYHFGKLNEQNNNVEVFNSETIDGSLSINVVNGRTAWFLNYIASAGNGDTIRFIYENNGYHLWEPSTHSYSKLRNSQHEDCGDPIPQLTLFNRNIIYQSKILKRVELAENYLIVHYANRDDIHNGKKITKITHHLDNGTLLKRVQFNYGYKGACDPPEGCRLFLESIDFFNGLNLKQHEPYVFDYFNHPIPCINSLGQDLWGYPNGKNLNAASLVPRVKMLGEWIGDADRSVDTAFITTGLMKKIQYPTGGYKEFDYEANSFGSIGINIYKEPATINHTKYVERDYCNVNYPYYKPLDSILLKHAQFVNLEHIFMMCEGNNGGVQGEEEYKTFILDSINRPLYSFYKDGNGGFQLDSVFLEKGKYYLMVGIIEPGLNPPNTNALKTKLTLKYKDYLIADSVQQFIEAHPTGGARLKRIRTNDAITNDVAERIFKYTDFENNSQSSGHLSAMPYYFSPTVNYVNIPNWFGGFITLECHGYTLSSMPSGLHEYVTGGHIVYPKVTELLGANGENGFVQYSFSYDNDVFYSTKPYQPPRSNADKRGDLLNKKVFDASNNKVYEEEIKYTYNDDTDDPNHKKVFGLKGAWVKCCASNYQLDEMMLMSYDISSRWKYRNFHQTITYGTGTSTPFATRNYYYYENPQHSLLTSSKTINSEGDTLISQFVYPPDLDISVAASAFASAVKTMNEHTFQVGKPLEATTLLHNSEGKYVLRSVLSEYKVYSYEGPNSQVLLNKQFVVENSTPIPYNDFRPIRVQNGIVQIDGSYGTEPEVNIVQYDDFSNIEQYITRDGISTAVIWGYNGKYPIAKAVNAERHQISYDPVTGQQVSPPGSFMSTYKYHPVFGITESTDPNGLTTYYEYDHLGRLTLIRDDSYNIIKHFKYNYASPN